MKIPPTVVERNKIQITAAKPPVKSWKTLVEENKKKKDEPYTVELGIKNNKIAVVSDNRNKEKIHNGYATLG